ncbi:MULTISPECIES: endo-1,4-beta-xylanase [Halorussus]|uniref:endo-1,4-beta-xylanase n=1 Tax=Halorussus TaxID=1070314 RepID=UPI0020A1ECC3|nr:endo-1,4-beta-xylanase [Halorussus vallis]USZ78386.1 endo-1,4-beta-xylanase [Halorussus vallis]
MSEETTLRDVADEAGFDLGAAVAAQPLRTDAGYWKTLRREFNAVTAENAMKMGPLRPEPGVYDFTDADAVANFAEEYDMTLRGHTLVWHNQLPEWFQEWDYTDEQLADFLRDHVHTVAGRYRGTVDAWDVVNEAVADDGSMRDTVWHRAMGERYLDKAFRWADEVAPDADLYYNDYGADAVNEKSDAVYDLVERLLDRDVPIDGVGLQMHALRGTPDPTSVAENVRRFADLGLDVQITEMDVSYLAADAPEDYLERQAEDYREILEACLEEGCATLVVWGVRDSDSWIPGWFPDVTEQPLLFSGDNEPKPAYHAVKDALDEHRDAR